ncbi:MAG TPA: NAD(P)-dependent oxidoreductase, partial [Terriglobales bacterium]
MTIAFIGLGRIGSGIAKNVQASGCQFVVYNRTPQKIQPFVAAGAKAAATPREAAASADIVITCLMDDQSVIGVLSGPDGVLAGMRRDTIHIGTSTISPHATTRIAALHNQHGSHYVAAPVLGRPDAAAAARLSTFVAGPGQIIARARPVLETYTQKIFDLGEDHSRAASMKLTANFFVASFVELMG